MKGMRVSSCILLVGMAVSLFAFLDGAALYQNYLNALYEADEYSYKETYMLDIMDSGHAEAIIDKLMECPGIVYRGDTMVYADASGKYYGSFLNMLVQNESMVYPVLSGSLPDSVPAQRQAVLGLNLEEYCYQREGSTYILLDGEEYEVTGVIGGQSDVLYAFDIMYNPDERQQCIELLESSGYLNVTLVSNETELEEYVLGLSDYVQSLGEESYVYYDKAEQTVQYADPGMSQRDFYWLICIFAIVNCVIISEFWILRRKQEIVIRKIWGFDNFRLLGVLYRDLLMLSLVAAAVVWLIQFFLVYVLKSDAGISLDIGRLLQSIGFIVVVSFILVLLPIYKAAVEMPCTNLEV